MTEVAEISQLKEAPEAMRVDRVYHDVLHRDADPRGKRKYELELRGGISLTVVRRELIESGEFRDGLEGRAEKDRTGAIEEAYQRVLGRDIDDEGRRAYIEGGQDIGKIIDDLVHSDEFGARQGETIRDEVRTLYQEVLGRESDEEGRERYVVEVAAGRNLREIRQEMIESGEFRESLEGRAHGDHAWAVEEVYRRILEREIDDAGRRTYIQGDRPIESVIHDLVNSDEFQEQKRGIIRADVEELYQNLLGRDADEIGVRHYIREIEQGKSLDAILEQLRQSREYKEKIRTEKRLNLPPLPGEKGGPSPQEAARMLSQGIVNASLLPFQGKDIGIVDRTRGGEEISDLEGHYPLARYDLIQPLRDVFGRPSTMIKPMHEKFGIPWVDSPTALSGEHILCVLTGRRDNAFVVQGVGHFGDSDFSERRGRTGFTLAFETERQQQYFMKWLESNPHEALYSVFLPMHPAGVHTRRGATTSRIVSDIFEGIREIRVEDEELGREYYERGRNREMLPADEAMARDVQSVAMAGRFPNGMTLEGKEFSPAPHTRIIQDRSFSEGITGGLRRGFTEVMVEKVMSFSNLLQQDGASAVIEIQPYDRYLRHAKDRPAYLAFSFMQEVEGRKEPVTVACAFSTAEAAQFMDLIKQSPEGASIIEGFLRRVKPDLFTNTSQVNIEKPTKLFILDEKAQYDVFESYAFIDRFYAFLNTINSEYHQEFREKVAAVKENLKDPSFTDSRITTRYY